MKMAKFLKGNDNLLYALGILCDEVAIVSERLKFLIVQSFENFYLGDNNAVKFEKTSALRCLI